MMPKPSNQIARANHYHGMLKAPPKATWWTPHHPDDVLMAESLNWTHRLSLIAIGISLLAILSTVLMAVF